jgi:hypothetical protein
VSPAWGIALLILGILVLLSSLGVISTGFWDIFLWLFAIGFSVSGLFGVIRAFPKGLVSLTIGVVLFLKLFNVVDLGFWAFVGVVAGAWLIQLGLYSFIWPGSIRSRHGWRRFRW